MKYVIRKYAMAAARPINLKQEKLESQLMDEIWEGEPRLLVQQQGATTDYLLELSPQLRRAAARLRDDGVEPVPTRLFTIDHSNRRIAIYPLITYLSGRLYMPKYERIELIWIDSNFIDDRPTTSIDAVGFLDTYLPSGFIKEIGYGLGLTNEMKPLIQAVEKVSGINGLYLTKQGKTGRNGNFFHIVDQDFSNIRSMFNRITRIHQRESLKERNFLAHNEVLHRALPEEFPEKVRAYEPGTIFKLIGGTNAATTVLKGADRVALLEAVKGNAPSIAKRDPKEFVQLQKDIELVSLDGMIEAFERKLGHNRNELEWQRLFEVNPFILSMIFGYPVVVVQASASVGGGTLSGVGTKIADFLSKNSSTYNAALVEIKRPGTPILGAEYRTGVWAPSRELMGAVVQVLDQRQKFVTNIASIKQSSRVYDLEAYSVDCVLVAGRTPRTPEEAASFELIRSQFKDVRVVTFDDLLGKLILLREMLSGERYVSTVDPAEYETELDEGEFDDDGPNGEDRHEQ